MNQKEKFMISEGLMMLAFAYAVSDYDLAACGFAVMALISAVIFHSIGSFRRGMIVIPACALAQILLIRSVKLDALIPEAGFLALCNTAFAWLWMKSSYKAVDDMIRYLSAAFILSLVLILGLPQHVINAFAGAESASLMQEVLFVCLIFLPCIAGYVFRCLKDYGLPVLRWEKAKVMEREVRLR